MAGSVKNTTLKLRKGTIHKALNPATGRVVSVKTAKEKAWSALSRYVRARDPYCVTCGSPTTEAGHYIHNSDKTNKQLGGNELWYDIRNVHGQCGACNRYHSGRLDVYGEYLEEKFEHGILQELRKLFNTPRKWTIPELLGIERKFELLARDLGVIPYEIT